MPGEFDSAENDSMVLTDIAAPMVAGLARADEPTRDRIKEEVPRLAAAVSPGGTTRVSGATIVATGEK